MSTSHHAASTLLQRHISELPSRQLSRAGHQIRQAVGMRTGGITCAWGDNDSLPAPTMRRREAAGVHPLTGEFVLWGLSTVQAIDRELWERARPQ